MTSPLIVSLEFRELEKKGEAKRSIPSVDRTIDHADRVKGLANYGNWTLFLLDFPSPTWNGVEEINFQNSINQIFASILIASLDRVTKFVYLPKTFPIISKTRPI